MRKTWLLLATFVASGCAAEGDKRVVVGLDQVPEGSICQQSGALDTFKGQVASAELGAQMMAAGRARKLRWVPFGAMITMDYSRTRLTVRLDQQNRVLSATCG
jgi:hypothetical protein